jgi:hypothetical protein
MIPALVLIINESVNAHIYNGQVYLEEIYNRIKKDCLALTQTFKSFKD